MDNTVMEKMWRLYLAGVENGHISGLESLDPSGAGSRAHIGLIPTQTGSNSEAIAIVERLIEKWSDKVQGHQQRKGQDMESLEKSNERKILELGILFLKAAEEGRADEVNEFIDAGFPVNFQHPLYHETALHIAAANNAKDVLNALDSTGRCDYLIRDARGKLAWNNAEFFSHNSDLSEAILTKTREQANQEGVALMEEHAAYLKQWFSEPWYNALSLDDEYTPAL